MRPSIFGFLCFLLAITDLWCQNPTITDIAPSSGGVGDSVTITGSNFGKTPDDNTVTFNKKTAKITTASDASIVAVVPAEATTGLVVVTVGKNSSNGKEFTLPTIEGISPESVAVGELVTVKVSGFDPTKTPTTVKFNGKPVKAPVLNADSIIAVVPPGATPGNVVVTAAGKASCW